MLRFSFYAMNKITKIAVVAGKSLFVVFTLFSLYVAFMVYDPAQKLAGFLIVGLVLLPTAFVMFFTGPLSRRFSGFARFWKFGKFAYIILMLIFLVILVGGFWRDRQKNATQEALLRINARRITMADVMGEHLPPAPDANINNLTVAGVDVNDNAIRDDVELAIFEKYPNSARIRAAELQYAQALQLELTEVFNSETLVATLQKEDLAYNCLSVISHDKSLKIVNEKEKELSDLIINTDRRGSKHSDDLKKYMTSYSLSPEQSCDLDFSSLLN